MKKDKVTFLRTKVISLIACVVLSVVITIAFYCLSSNSDGRLIKSLATGLMSFNFLVAICYAIFILVFDDKFSMVVVSVATFIGALICMILIKVFWVFILIISVALITIIILTLVAVYARKLTVTMDSDNPNYKTYQQRKEQKKEQEQEKQEEPLPEIKSFK